MEKIAVALQRTLSADAHSDVLFGSVEPAGAPPAPVAAQVPAQIRYTRTRSIDVPSAVLERHRVATLAGDADADVFRMLRTELLNEMRKNDWRTLAITSPNKGAGKSTIAVNLAVSFALEVDHTALLVDADLRDPDLRSILELPAGTGLSDYLTGQAPLEELLLHPRNVGHLVVLPGGSLVANSSELLRSPMMADLVRELRNRYPDRIVIFDLPPALSGADTLALSTLMDATIVLVEERKTRRADLERTLDLLRDCNIVGMVLNKSHQLPKPDPITTPEPGLLQRLLGRWA
jgi:capsular exopolysaccharide synthesis family protein